MPALVFIKGSIAKRKGNEKIYLPATKAKTANSIEEKIIIFLT